MKAYLILATWLILATSCQSPSVSVTKTDPTVISETERMNRIHIDFNKDRAAVTDYIKAYYPEVTDSMLDTWEKEKSLEVMEIDGEKWYFTNAGPNLFRINKEAQAVKEAKDGVSLSGSEQVNMKHLPEVMNELRSSGTTQSTPVGMEVTYTLTVKANVVPDGEIIRCWLPYPREDNRRQKNVALLAVSDSEYTIAPKDALHRTLYMEKKAVKDQQAVFSFSFRYTSAAEWFNLTDEMIQPYDTSSTLYKEFTAERSTHILFTPAIRELSRQVVGNETRPLQMVRKIFTYINNNYPWASAREYSTVPNIPEYVIENKHGDCGMVSLLFITLCRLNGIPAKWQSGFMMHPGDVNLHDWAEIYFKGIGWVPVDQSFGIPTFASSDDTRYFFSNGIDAYRLIVNDDFSAPLVPAKQFTRSETVDFQRGEVEWRKGNLYFDQWKWKIDVKYPTNLF